MPTLNAFKVIVIPFKVTSVQTPVSNIIKPVNSIETVYLPAQDLQHMTLWSIYEAIFGKKDPILNNLNDEDLKEIMTFNNEKLESYSETLMSHKVYDLVKEK